jgi:hypothetical protein
MSTEKPVANIVPTSSRTNEVALVRPGTSAEMTATATMNAVTRMRRIKKMKSFHCF